MNLVPSEYVNILVVITDGESRDAFDQNGNYRSKYVSQTLGKVAESYDFVIPVAVGADFNRTALSEIRGKYDYRQIPRKTYKLLIKDIKPIERGFENKYRKEPELARKKRTLMGKSPKITLEKLFNFWDTD